MVSLADDIVPGDNPVVGTMNIIMRYPHGDQHDKIFIEIMLVKMSSSKPSLPRNYSNSVKITRKTIDIHQKGKNTINIEKQIR